MKQFPRLCGAILFTASALACNAALAEKTALSITRQNGILYLPTHVMEKQQLSCSLPFRTRSRRCSSASLTAPWSSAP
jgi:hypothetical protein